MKQILNRLFLFGILGSFVLLYSCGEDDPEEPVIDPPTISMTAPTGDNVTITENTADITVLSGEEVNFTFQVGAAAGINVVRTEGEAFAPDQITFSKNSIEIPEGATSATVSFGGVFTGAVQSTTQFTVVVVEDTDANQRTAVFTVNITIDGTPAKSLTAQLLFVPDNDGAQRQDSKTFFSSNVTIDEKNTFSVDDVQTDAVEVNSIDIDFGFFQGASTAINIASPTIFDANNVYDLDGTFGWVALNETNMKLTTLDSDAFIERTTVEEIQAEYDAVSGDPSASLNNLVVGNVIAMRTDADKAGGSKTLLVLIKNQFDANGNGEFDDVGDYIELEILIEE
ncbi:MAG: hypothetical protein AAFQ94_27965 [Bacteroidota bacterium]